MKYFSQFILFLIAIAFLLALQYQYWQGGNGRADSDKLNADITTQKQMIAAQIEKNRILRADVQDLKTGLEAVEEHARLDLGLIKPNETFVQLSTAPVTHTSLTKPSLNFEDAVVNIPE